MPLLLDLADACRKSGLKVVELDGWEDNWSGGDEAYQGIGIHHTGSYDNLTDADNDLDYARWMAFQGRTDLDPPLCNLALSAEAVVYVCASGNANGMGEVKASGPIPAARDGNALYIVIEAMNSGTQGWGSIGRDAAGNPVTQREAYHRLCAALCRHYRWEAARVRAHHETSVTGKWDPGDPDGVPFNGHRVMDMPAFRGAVAALIDNPQEDVMNKDQERKLDEVLATVTLIERMNRRKLERVNARLARANTYLREQRVDLDAVRAEIAAALAEGEDGDASPRP